MERLACLLCMFLIHHCPAKINKPSGNPKFLYLFLKASLRCNSLLNHCRINTGLAQISKWSKNARQIRNNHWL